MAKKGELTKGLAIGGTALVWLPILAPIVFALASLGRAGRFLFDYLMPAELFPVALVGGILLIWASIRAGSQQKLIGWSMGLSFGILIVSQVIAVIGQSFYGDNEPPLWLMAIMLTMIIAYALGLIVIGVAGIRLLRDLFKAPHTSALSP